MTVNNGNACVVIKMEAWSYNGQCVNVGEAQVIGKYL